jgi:hypothetical protein
MKIFGTTYDEVNYFVAKNTHAEAMDYFNKKFATVFYDYDVRVFTSDDLNQIQSYLDHQIYNMRRSYDNVEDIMRIA